MDTVFNRIKDSFFFGLLFLVTLGFLWLIQEYLIAIVWAIVLSVLFYPVYTRIRQWYRGNGTLASLTTVGVALLVVFLPLGAIGGIIATEALNLYGYVSQGNLATLFTAIESLPFVDWIMTVSHVSFADIQTSLAGFLQSTSTTLASGALGAGAHVANFAAKTLVMLYLLFFLLKDGPGIGAQIMRYVPLGDEKEVFLFSRFSATTRAIVKGSLIVAIAQGAAGALLFWAAGIQNPILWGALMALCALIPAVGPAIVWVPAAFLLLFFGNIVGAVLVLAGGLIVISTLDNLLRPVLVGRDTGIPDALILLSVLGGLGTFGLTGLILGPVIAALFLALWELFEKDFRSQLIDRG